jgi:hypothetical protein
MDKAIDLECQYKFLDKFNTNYFIAYTLVDKINMLSNYTLLDRLQDVYNNIPGLLRLGQFSFSKLDKDKTFVQSIKYISNVKLTVFYKYLSEKDLNHILAYVGKYSCK